MEPTNHNDRLNNSDRLYEEIEVEEAFRLAGDGADHPVEEVDTGDGSSEGSLNAGPNGSLMVGGSPHARDSHAPYSSTPPPLSHGEVRSVDPTDVLAGPWGEVEVVNRSKGGLSPFAEIVKTENFAENSGNLTGYSIEAADPGRPTGYRHLGNVSANYLLLSNRELHDVAMEVAARSGFVHRPSKVFWDGGRYMEVVEFDDVAYDVDPGGESGGDPVRLCLVAKNSYNRAWPLEVTLAAVRAICENGMIAGTRFARVRFKHVESNLGGQSLSEVVGEAMRMLESADADLRTFVDGLRRLKGTPATHDVMREVRRRVLTPDVFGSQKWGDVTDRFYRSEEPTLYGLLNASTYTTWHGRISAADVRQNEAAVTGLLAFAAEHRN